MRFKRQAVRLILVGALGLAGASAISATALAAGTRSSTTPPATPTSVAVAPGPANKAFIVSWTDSSTGIVRFTATATASGQPSRACVTTLDTCRIGEVAVGVTYRISVVAKNKAGSSAPSSSVEAAIGAPGAPQAVRAIPKRGAVVVHWAAPTLGRAAGITGYTATAANDTSRFSCSTQATVLTGPARTCTITGLVSGKAYAVTVIAANQYGSSSPSAAVTVVAR